MISVGFTGSRRMLIEPQRDQLITEVHKLHSFHSIHEAHHGDCTGGDEYFHQLIMLQYSHAIIHVHSPKNESNRAFVPIRLKDVLHPPKDYLLRNKDIIEQSTTLIGCPGSMTFSLRSGSWWTIEAAKKANKHVIVILPNGTVEQYNVAF
jgi:hypothetical protein